MKKTLVVNVETATNLKIMGNQIRLARKRRGLKASELSERVGISRTTLWGVESGSPTVSIGVYAAILHELDGMDVDFKLVAREDPVGRRLQDMRLEGSNIK